MAPEDIPLGSWRRLYIAVLVTAFLAMGLAYLFSRWPY
jgi:anti-sigma-K factor RskA